MTAVVVMVIVLMMVVISSSGVIDGSGGVMLGVMAVVIVSVVVMDANSLMEPLQSVYRPGHSTETTLTRITNDILSSPFFLVLLSLWHC